MKIVNFFFKNKNFSRIQNFEYKIIIKSLNKKFVFFSQIIEKVK